MPTAPCLSAAEREKLEAKREKAIREKEERRQAGVAAIRAEKQQKSQLREQAANEKQRLEDERKKLHVEREQRRQANIKKKEVELKQKQERSLQEKAKKPQHSSKQSKSDILWLKTVFDEYDVDGNGEIVQKELYKGMTKSKTQKRPGQPSSRWERQAADSVHVSDLFESLFEEIDRDGSGTVTFAELLKTMYPHATKDEFTTMISWVAPPEEPPPPPKKGLSDSQIQEIKEIFNIYDTDRDGSVSLSELKKAMARTGMDVDDIQPIFSEHDTNNDDSICFQEFVQLMESTGVYSADD